MKFLVDSSWWLRGLQKDHPDQSAVWECLNDLRQRGHELCITNQVVAEVFCAATAVGRRGLGISAEKANEHIRDIEALCTRLEETPESMNVARALAVEHGLKGAKTHDARLAGVMKQSEMTRILSYDPDFDQYEGVMRLEASQVQGLLRDKGADRDLSLARRKEPDHEPDR